MKEELLKNPVLQKLVKEGKIEIQAAYYNLQTGSVEIL
jgi:carbonic anhydrase